MNKFLNPRSSKTKTIKCTANLIDRDREMGESTVIQHPKSCFPKLQYHDLNMWWNQYRLRDRAEPVERINLGFSHLYQHQRYTSFSILKMWNWHWTSFHLRMNYKSYFQLENKFSYRARTWDTTISLNFGYPSQHW